MDFKTLLDTILKNDQLLQDAIAAIKEAVPSFKDIFKGTFKEKFAILVKGLATFIVVFEEKCIAQYQMTEDEVIDKMSEWLDNAIQLPWYLEYLDGPVFHYVITEQVKYIKAKAAPAADSPITAMYEANFEAVATTA